MTIVPAGLLWPIDGPLPRRRDYDLLSVVEMVDTLPRAEAGVQVYPYPPDLPGIHNPCSAGSYGVKDEGEGTEVVKFGAFTAYLPIMCTTRGMGDDVAFRNRAVRAMEARESYAVELELSRDYGVIGNPHLTQGGISSLGTVKPSEALARLENAIAATTAQEGLIHMDPATATALSREYLVMRDGNILRTAGNRTPVAAGAAYVGIHPADLAAPNESQGWMFATGPVHVVRSEIFIVPDTIGEAVDREFNDVVYRAERNYVVDWDTAFLAEALADRSL